MHVGHPHSPRFMPHAQACSVVPPSAVTSVPSAGPIHMGAMSTRSTTSLAICRDPSTNVDMNKPKVVTQEEWLQARKGLLAKEKEHSRARDALAAERRALPMVKVDKRYAFESTDGKRALVDLFGKHPQLVVYHFMFDPDWKEGCKSCSLIADNVEGAWRHFQGRDTSFVMASRARLETLEAFKKRMGWTMPWVSSFGNDFNYDYGVSFRTEADGVGYNYGTGKFGKGEAPGLSCFFREGQDVFHTYSTYSRGLDLLIGTYHYLDLTPLGRHEEDLPYGMAWVKHHDKYVNER
jgi:predicted dithiol-disulfide oxidoreductase (DUF899 family)